MNTLFENYELFLKEHSNDITSPSDAIKLIADASMFRSYVDALTENLSPTVRSNVIKVCDRQRQMLLTEAANVPASAFGFGWTVLSFPVLVDIYAEPIISELCNVYTTDSAIASVPRARIYATTTNYDGTTSEVVIPTAKQLVRPNYVTKVVPPATSYNVLNAVFSSDASKFKMNRRYLMVTKVTMTCTASGGGTTARQVTVNFRPDNRAQIFKEFTFAAADNATVTASFQGHVNWDTGVVSYNVVVLSDGGTTDTSIEVTNATFQFRFSPVNSMIGRTKVISKIETTDVTIDLADDFLIDLTAEELQDYRSIFKIDLVRTHSEAIKRQVLLNKDFDLSYFLQSSQSEIGTNGASATINFNNYYKTNTLNYQPASALDIFKNIAPKIAYVSGIIRRNFNAYPQYIVTGLNTASMLRSLQDMLVSMPGQTGTIGFSGSVASFLKMNVLESPAIPNDDIYLSTKAEQNALENSSILDLVYMPLYTVAEVTDGNTRNYIRSRTMIEVVRTEGLGYIKCENLDVLLNDGI